MTPRLHPRTLVLAACILATAPSFGAIIGTEDFSYANGPINNLAGGTGWNRSGGVSNWGSSGATIVNGALVTDANVGAFREYGGDENASAFQATGIIYYKFTLSFGATVPNYAGLSSFDFGTEKVFFGRVYTNKIGIEESGVGDSFTTIDPTPNTTYTMVGVLDFDHDQLSLFVNPNGSDVYNPSSPTGAGNTADAIRTGFTSTNWSSQIRLQSGDQGTGVAPASWDNVTVATAPQDVGLAAPEPATAGLLGVASLGLLGRRRRK